jgi:hypothetical protein
MVVLGEGRFLMSEAPLYLGSPIQWARGRFRSKVDAFQPQPHEVNLRKVGDFLVRQSYKRVQAPCDSGR